MGIKDDIGINKFGEIWMCIKYKNLNDVTMKDEYPSPRIDDILKN